ncbi:hypothetical protein GCM10009772_04540 [Pseudonocardia alni subsp. carboxydivorans]
MEGRWRGCGGADAYVGPRTSAGQRQGRQAALVIRMQSTWMRATRQVTGPNLVRSPGGHNGRARRSLL